MAFMDKFAMAGRVVLVTGGAQGIGKTVAEALADCGAKLAIVDINGDMAKETAAGIRERYGAEAEAFFCDVTDSASVDGMLATVTGRFGTLDGVFNNAGICQHKAADQLTDEEWYKVVNVNYNGVYFVARAAAKYWIAAGKPGAIVNTASMSGTIVNIPQKQASYNSSKAAVVHLTKSLAVEWAEYGIRVNSISPGYIFTDMTLLVDPELRKFWEGLIPFKRLGTPEELAGGVIYLLSDAATYTSGADLIMDGCFTCI